MATLVLAAGVPMMVAGDELGRTQGGNNNAYCQDSPTSWVHWDTRHEWAGLTDLTRRLLALRAEHPVFRRTTFRHGEQLVDTTNHPTGRKNLAWFGGGRDEMTAEDWNDPHRRTLGVYLAHDAPNRDHDEAFLVWFHGGRGRGPRRAARRRLGRHLHRRRAHRRRGRADHGEDPGRHDAADPRAYGRGPAGRLTPPRPRAAHQEDREPTHPAADGRGSPPPPARPAARVVPPPGPARAAPPALPGAAGSGRARDRDRRPGPAHRPVRRARAGLPAARAAGPLPLLVNLHGGGFVFGNLGGADWLCGRLADRVGAVVVSVDYRLAPEHPAPEPYEDALGRDVLAARARGVARRRPRPGRRRGRERRRQPRRPGHARAARPASGRPEAPVFGAQVLIYPSTDLTMTSGSATAMVDAPVLGRTAIDWYGRQYVPQGLAHSIRLDDPRVSPLHAPDHSDLPAGAARGRRARPVARRRPRLRRRAHRARGCRSGPCSTPTPCTASSRSPASSPPRRRPWTRRSRMRRPAHIPPLGVKIGRLRNRRP